eukprot:TRINITY_DN607_c0_g1_i7.p1 TRINITY_DN607_c0_g1~~TRINITY_DN607_c0_g1_i7.p1  ORF type:complete len:178 (-),score=25.44 TRINITY_DN607_c0_g1_i7:477-1010(-)
MKSQFGYFLHFIVFLLTLWSRHKLCQMHQVQIWPFSKNVLIFLHPCKSTIVELRNLESLVLSHNRLTEVNSSILGCGKLVELEVDSNFLEFLDPLIIHAPSLVWLVVDNNPNLVIPDVVLSAHHLQVISGIDEVQEIVPGVFMGGPRFCKDKEGLKKKKITHILRMNNLGYPGYRRR